MSNYWRSPIEMDGKTWPTTEHYFQAQKFPTRPEHQEAIRVEENCDKAKEMGYQSEGFRKDWGAVKDQVMYEALLAKFTQHTDLAEKLIKTGNAQIVEHTEEDKYWGDGGDGGNDTIGKNMLGKTLMRVREAIQQKL